MKVLLPIDGSIYSDRAVEYICEHSSLRAKTDTVYLLNVQKTSLRIRFQDSKFRRDSG